MPLLKGGPCGLIGTAPFVFSVNRVIQETCDNGSAAVNVSWREIISNDIGCPFDEHVGKVFKEMGAFVGSDIRCPKCVE